MEDTLKQAAKQAAQVITDKRNIAVQNAVAKNTFTQKNWGALGVLDLNYLLKTLNSSLENGEGVSTKDIDDKINAAQERLKKLQKQREDIAGAPSTDEQVQKIVDFADELDGSEFNDVAIAKVAAFVTPMRKK